MAPPEVISAMNRVHQYTMLSAPTTAQYAALEALRSCDTEVVEMRKQYNRRRRFVLSRFEEMGIDCFEAKGAFYVFPECPWDDRCLRRGAVRRTGRRARPRPRLR